jgi:hypothetical protein
MAEDVVSYKSTDLRAAMVDWYKFTDLRAALVDWRLTGKN